MTTPTVSIIIVNYNNRELLKKCLQAVEKLDYPKKHTEVIVVDNHSSDDSVKLVESEFPNITLIKEHKNHGFANGNNIGVRSAAGKYVVLLNNDTEVDKKWLTTLVERIEQDRSIGAVNSKTFLAQSSGTPLVQNAGNLVFKSGFGRDRGAVVTNSHQSYYEEDNEYFSQPTTISAFCGVSVIMRKSDFEKYGGFDPKYFAYYEDTDLSLTMRRHGKEMWFEPASQLVHHHASTSGEFSPLFVYHTEKNRIALLIKHFPWHVFWQELILYKLQSLGSLARWLKLSIQGKKEARDWGRKWLIRTRVLFWVLLNFSYFYRQRTQLNRSATVSLVELWHTLY